MRRRDFLTAACAAGAAPLTSCLLHGQSAGGATQRDYYELRRYQLDTEKQKEGLDLFLQRAMIPALNRIQIAPVGVFYPQDKLGPAHVLLRHRSLESFARGTERLLADSEFLAAGADFLQAAASDPAYKRIECSLLAAFAGMPQLETPIRSEGRILQLRIYESPSVLTGQKKIEMFNRAEIAIFRTCGLHPVFFGESIAGDRMPNLTYMLVFKDDQERQANWRTFVNHPEWKQISSLPEYADKKILCGITNLFLRPASCSQI
ncbi:MAG: NIPSNAP family protein [Sedimentisphaerales bacterium]|nr:NIPSNAP family protein [Sedimentisphaerales bacterium]